MTEGPSPKELVRRTVAMARQNRMFARRRPLHAQQLRDDAAHQMRLARELKRVAENFRSYY